MAGSHTLFSCNSFIHSFIHSLVDDTGSTPHNTPVNIPVLANDTAGLDVHSIVDQPTNGTVSILPDGTVTYTPDPGYVGQDVFTYRACDPATKQCTEANVTVTVGPPASPAPSPAACEFVKKY